MTTTPLRLGAFLPYRLSVLSNTVSRNIAALYDREFGLNIWQWRVMAVLGEAGQISATDITTRTKMDKVAVSRAVTGLTELGYISRTPSAEDGRRTVLELTPSGARTYAEIVPLALQAEQDLLASLSEKDRTELARLMAKLAAASSPDEALW